MEITMCASQNCPKKDTCYRVQAKPGDYQSWSNFEYVCNEENGFCDYMFEVKQRKENKE